MKKSKKEELNKYLVILMRVASVVLCVYFFLNIFFLDTFSVASYVSQKNRLSRITVSNENITRQNRQLEYEIELLRNDSSYIESIARRNFTMVKEGETVFIFRR